jgi:putative ABC transport system permease protein
MSPRWKKIWADLRDNKARTALVVLSIVVGIFAVGSIAGTSAIIDRESKSLWQSVDPASATLITTPFDTTLAEEINALEAVDTIQLRRSVNARTTTEAAGEVDIQLFTVPDYENIALNRITPESGAWPPPADAVLIERNALGFLGVAEGDTLTITLPTGESRDFVIAGVTYDLSQPASSVLGTAYGYIAPQTMQTISESDGWNVLQFTVTEDALAASDLGEEAVAEQVANSIRDLVQQQGVIVVAPPQIATPGEPPGYIFIVALLVVLGVIGSLTFVLSGLLIVNIMSALLSQQTKQIGVMKAIGGRTGQITRLYLGMAAIFGVFALIIALPLSFLGARGLATIIGDLNNYKITDFSAPVWVFVVQIVIGLIIPVVAALIPVWSGTRVTVREALDSDGIDQSNDGFIDRLLARLKMFPRPILISFRNVFRQKGRLTLTLLTLALAGAIFATVFTVRNSLFATLDDALGYDDYSVAVDLNEAYPRDDLLATVEGIDNVENVEAWLEATERLALDDADDLDVTVRGLPADSDMIVPIINTGDWLADSDIENGIVVNGNIADAGVEVGDTITLVLRGEPTEWQVIGVAQAVFSFENVAWTRYDTLADSIGETGLARTLRLDTSPNDQATQEAVVAAISDRFGQQGFIIDGTETFTALENSFNTRFNVLVFSLLALALLLAVVGGLGIAGTTSINVIERMREIGVMRSVGAANYQILGIFILEAVFVGAIGWAIGSLLALPISRLLSDGVGLAFSNAPLSYSFDVAGALLWLVVASALAFIFSYLPARRASQLTLREVLAYEG